MDLVCYVHPGWKPTIRPAGAHRDWMDATAESFATRCLPLTIANAHGWEVPCPVDFEAYWNGGVGERDVSIRLLAEPENPHDVPVQIFGNGVLSFHVFGLFRTPPGWNLWVGGSPNHLKDGIGPLTGIIETDWSPYSFTMNWRFTRPDQIVRFRKGEPICHLFPIRRDTVEGVVPKLVPMDSDPELMGQFRAWCASRNEFAIRMREHPPGKPADKWQKKYFRGIDMHGAKGIPDHQSKVRAAPFEPGTVEATGARMQPDSAPRCPYGHGATTEASAAVLPEATCEADHLGDALRRVADALAMGAPPGALEDLLVAMDVAPEDAARASARARMGTA